MSGRDLADPLKLIIVRDMLLTGYDAPVLNTMYIDKPMSGHNLMRAIVGVNRVFGDKEGGLVVDYIGIAQDLKQALAVYTANNGRGQLAFDQEEAVARMVGLYEIVVDMFGAFDYRRYFDLPVQQKLNFILQAANHIAGLSEEKRGAACAHRQGALQAACRAPANRLAVGGKRAGPAERAGQAHSTPTQLSARRPASIRHWE